MIDHYPTRVYDQEGVLPRREPVIGPSTGALTAFQRMEYETNGYLIIKGFAKAVVPELYAFAVENYYNPEFFVSQEPSTKRVRSLLCFHESEPAKALATNSVLRSIVSEIMGGNPYVHQSRINYKEGMESNGWKWHSDFETWHYQDGMPKMHCVSAMIALEDNTPANGPLMILPGSQNFFFSCEKPKSNSSAEENFADQKEGIPSENAIRFAMDNSQGRIDVLTCSAGDLVLFDCNVLHVSNPNVTPYGRKNMFFVYNRVDNKLVAPFSGLEPRPIEMGTR